MSEQQQASAGEVPGFPRGALVEKISGPEWRGKVVGYYSSTFTPEGLVIECIADGAKGQVHVEPAKRMRLVEPEPVDPLREALDDCWHLMTGPRGKAIDALTAELRARGVTVAKRD